MSTSVSSYKQHNLQIIQFRLSNPGISPMLASVGIITYNQSSYIEQCLDSIINQITNFDFEIIIGDDNSTDETRIILEKYQKKHPHLIKLIFHDENIGISRNNHAVITACKGKYIALCEGDDFWISPHKLQLQVDFLEKHTDYGFVGSYNDVLYPNGTQHLEDNNSTYGNTTENWTLYGDVFEDCGLGPITRTQTLCFRQSILAPYLHCIEVGNDMVLQTILSKHTKYAKLNQTTAVYRLTGISNSVNFDKQLLYIRWYINNVLALQKLFPNDFNIDNHKLFDRETYIILKQNIYNNKWHRAIKTKQQLKSSAYKNKRYSKLLVGPISCFCLMIYMRLKYEKDS